MLTHKLDDYCLNRAFLPITCNDWTGSRTHESDMLIGLGNCYELVYASSHFLFHCNQSHGADFIKAVYNAVPEKTRYLYLLYTNTFHGMQLGRVMQALWAFPDKKTVLKYLGEMEEMCNEASHSHLIKLPIKPDFDAPNWIDQFIDPNYSNDKLNFAMINLNTLYHRKQEQMQHQPMPFGMMHKHKTDLEKHPAVTLN